MGLILAALEDGAGNCAKADTHCDPVHTDVEENISGGKSASEADAAETATKERPAAETRAGEGGTLFNDDDIEKVEPPKNGGKGKTNIFKMLWGQAQKAGKRISEETDKLIEDVSGEEV